MQIKTVVIVLVSIVASALIIATFAQYKSKGAWINCGLSEISPDFTNKMREACRQARRQYESGLNK